MSTEVMRIFDKQRVEAIEDISKELDDLHDRIEKDIEDDKHEPEEEEESGDEEE